MGKRVTTKSKVLRRTKPRAVVVEHSSVSAAKILTKFVDGGGDTALELDTDWVAIDNEITEKGIRARTAAVEKQLAWMKPRSEQERVRITVALTMAFNDGARCGRDLQRERQAERNRATTAAAIRSLQQSTAARYAELAAAYDKLDASRSVRSRLREVAQQFGCGQSTVRAAVARAKK